MPNNKPDCEGACEPNLAANKPPETNTDALATPAKNLCANSTLESVKKPVNAIKQDAVTDPTMRTLTAPHFFNARGVNNAPTK